MTWVAQPIKPEEIFKPASQVAIHKKGLKILLYGPEDTMKTGFALSCPPPVYIIDTELGAPPLFRFFPEKEIHWCDGTYLDPNTDMPDPLRALQRLEATISLLKDVPKGTVAIDSGTDVWDWIEHWLEEVGKKKEGQVLRFEWYKAKQRWRQLILRLMAKPLHFVMTAQPQAIYVSDGRGGYADSGEIRPRLEKASPHVFDIVVRTMKWNVEDPATKKKKVHYMAEVTKCRFSKDFRPAIEEITFDKLTAKLKEQLGIEVW